MAANILLLIGTVLLAIAEVFIVCLAGYILGRMNILNKHTRKQLNHLNTLFFTPALVFTKVTFSLTIAQLKELWLIPLLFIVITVVSSGVAYLLALLLQVKPAHRNFAMAAAMFMNSNVLPIPLMQSLIGSVAELKRNENDTQDDMLSRSITYLMLFSTFGNIARWSFGVKLLEKADDHAPETPDGPERGDLEMQQSDRHMLSNNPPTSPSQPRSHLEAVVAGNIGLPHSHCEESQRQDDLSEELPQSSSGTRSIPIVVPEPSRQHVPLSTNTSCSTLATHTASTAAEDRPGRNRVVDRNSPSRLQHFTKILKTAWAGFYDFMTAPVWAALLSIIVALIPPLQRLISNHMPPLRNALEIAGECAIPLALVVLGAYFYTPPPIDAVVPPLKERFRNAFKFRAFLTPKIMVKKDNDIRHGERRTVLIAIISRQILCPLIVLPMVLLLAHFNVPTVSADPVFIVSSVLLVSAPVALTLAQMSTKTGASDSFERLLSTTIFHACCTVTPPLMVVYVVIGLLLAKF